MSAFFGIDECDVEAGTAADVSAVGGESGSIPIAMERRTLDNREWTIEGFLYVCLGQARL